jgi:hypothetical protein
MISHDRSHTPKPYTEVRLEGGLSCDQLSKRYFVNVRHQERETTITLATAFSRTLWTESPETTFAQSSPPFILPIWLQEQTNSFIDIVLKVIDNHPHLVSYLASRTGGEPTLT